MITSKQKSKKPSRISGSFNYVFECVTSDGLTKQVKVAAGNDSQAKILAELECEKSITASFQKGIRDNIRDNCQYYFGATHVDLNFPGRTLLISDDEHIYSFDKNDILGQHSLSNNKIAIQVRTGALGYKSTPFTVGTVMPGFNHIVEDMLPPSPVITKGFPRAATKDDIKKIKGVRPLNGTLASVASYWTNKCEHGDVETNNCAHYLSDAFIKAGYVELTRAAANAHIKEWCDWNSPPRKQDARPIRAENMKNWFASKATISRRMIQSNSGFWAVYQLNPANSQGHVLLYDSDDKVVYGTLDPRTQQPYFFTSWDQYWYQW